MDSSIIKLNFIQEFLRLQNEQVIQKMVNILHQEKRKLYEKEMTPMSIQEFYRIIDDSEEDVKQGNLISSDELMKNVDTWT